MSKINLKNKALELRKTGFSYSEILKDIPVAKSTLSVWFKEVGLSVPQKQRLTQKRIEAALRGALKRKIQRQELSKKIKLAAAKELGFLNKKIFWLMGAVLYWAEGNKQKANNVSCGVKFSNSDPKMIKFFYRWLIKVCDIEPEDIYFELYIHKGCDVADIKKFWAKILEKQFSDFDRVRYKPNKLKSYRKNTGEDYYGLIRVNVVRSANFNRKITGWIEGLCERFELIH